MLLGTLLIDTSGPYFSTSLFLFLVIHLTFTYVPSYSPSLNFCPCYTPPLHFCYLFTFSSLLLYVTHLLYVSVSCYWSSLHLVYCSRHFCPLLHIFPPFMFYSILLTHFCYLLLTLLFTFSSLMSPVTHFSVTCYPPSQLLFIFSTLLFPVTDLLCISGPCYCWVSSSCPGLIHTDGSDMGSSAPPPLLCI